MASIFIVPLSSRWNAPLENGVSGSLGSFELSHNVLEKLASVTAGQGTLGLSEIGGAGQPGQGSWGQVQRVTLKSLFVAITPAHGCLLPTTCQDSGSPNCCTVGSTGGLL